VEAVEDLEASRVVIGRAEADRGWTEEVPGVGSVGAIADHAHPVELAFDRLAGEE
jgi:hypothetical protein